MGESSIAIGRDGNPVIANYQINGPSSRLRIVHCGNIICSSGNTSQNLDSSAANGQYNSITIDDSGLPIVSYYDLSNDDMKVIRCGNLSCSSGNNTETIDGVAQLGEYNSITIGSDGRPIISYFDRLNSDLIVAHCGNSACSSGNTITTVDSAAQVGKYTDIAIGSDNLPIISYYDELNRACKSNTMIKMSGIIMNE